MNKLTFTTALVMAMTTSSVFAHHPATEVVDAEIYEMIDDNVANTPHADMVMDDMGSTMEQAATVENSGAIDMAEAAVGTDVAMDSSNIVDTIDLMENVADSLAQ